MSELARKEVLAGHLGIGWAVISVENGLESLMLSSAGRAVLMFGRAG
jgi:hypothetical protein